MSNDPQHTQPQVSPLDPAPSQDQDKTKTTFVTVRSDSSSSASSGRHLASPRTPRFAEATSVISPINPTESGRNPFSDPPQQNTRHVMAQPQPSDIGFGYLADNQASKHSSFAEVPVTPNSPLRSALKVPGTPGKGNPLSPTFKEEQMLDKAEDHTTKQNAKDLKIKTRVRLAKMCLRFTNFSCSLIVLAMISSTFQIFNATRNLPKRGKANAWAPKAPIWPQVTMLTIACVSLVMALGVMWAYLRGGHKRAEKAAVYYTFFAIAFFTFSIVMWAVGAYILAHSKTHNNGQDIWGWACNNNQRAAEYQNQVDFNLVCRMQHWSLICAFIEIFVEVITIAIYAVVFYRFHSKRRLHKSMDVRDKARSDLYLAQLKSQSAPNTPGLKSPVSPRFPAEVNDDVSAAEMGESTQFASKRQSFSQPKPFALQPPPIKIHSATPTTQQDGFDHMDEKVQEHVPAAPGEQTYDAVPIPGAYSSPMTSPGIQNFSHPGQAVTTNQKLESPPASPRPGFRHPQ